jgi:hypothetical protein
MALFGSAYSLDFVAKSGAGLVLIGKFDGAPENIGYFL